MTLQTLFHIMSISMGYVPHRGFKDMNREIPGEYVVSAGRRGNEMTDLEIRQELERRVRELLPG